MKFEANKIVSIIFIGKISFEDVYFGFTVFSSKPRQNFLVTNYENLILQNPSVNSVFGLTEEGNSICYWPPIRVGLVNHYFLSLSPAAFSPKL